jgi:hypothetical protein
MKLATRSLLVCLLGGLPLAASAQVAAPPPPPPPPDGTVVAAPMNPGLDEDPHIDRAWFSPTAITQPRGTASFNDWELALLGITYGVTDNFQLTGMVVPPIVEDMPFIGMVSAKLGGAISDRVHVAALAGVGYAHVDDDQGTAAGLGGALSLCIDEECASLISAYAYGVWFWEETDDAFPIAFGVSLIGRLGRHVKLVVEVSSAGVLARDDSELAEGIVVGYGVRFFTGNIAGDVGFIRPFAFDGDDDFADELILGVPAVTFSYRWGGR